MERFEEFYSLKLEVFRGSNLVSESNVTSSVGEFFSEEGELDLSALRKTVESLLKGIKKKTN